MLASPVSAVIVPPPAAPTTPTAPLVTPVGRRSALLVRLMRDRVALVSALVLSVVVLAALFAPWVAP